MTVQLVPRVCKALTDQSLCPKAIESCGADTDPDLCTIKLIAKGIVSTDGNFKVLPAYWKFSKDVYHGSMRLGHDYLHAVWSDTKWWWINDCCKAALGG